MPTENEITRKLRYRALHDLLSQTEPDPDEALLQLRKAEGEEFFEPPPTPIQRFKRAWEQYVVPAGEAVRSMIEPDPENPAGSVAVAPFGPAARSFANRVQGRALGLMVDPKVPLPESAAEATAFFHLRHPRLAGLLKGEDVKMLSEIGPESGLSGTDVAEGLGSGAVAERLQRTLPRRQRKLIPARAQQAGETAKRGYERYLRLKERLNDDELLRRMGITESGAK